MAKIKLFLKEHKNLFAIMSLMVFSSLLNINSLPLPEIIFEAGNIQDKI